MLLLFVVLLLLLLLAGVNLGKPTIVPSSTLDSWARWAMPMGDVSTSGTLAPLLLLLPPLLLLRLPPSLLLLVLLLQGVCCDRAAIRRFSMGCRYLKHSSIT